MEGRQFPCIDSGWTRPQDVCFGAVDVHAPTRQRGNRRNGYPHGRPCGYHGDPTRSCSRAISRYQKRISGPLLDRIDIHVEVPRVEYEKLTGKTEAEASAIVRQRVLAARERQARRFAGHERVRVNAEMGPAEVRKYCEVDPTAQPLLRAAAQRLQLSARAFHRTLTLAGTIVALAGVGAIAAPHIAEALQYRPRVDMG